MLNKRAATLLALILAGSMVLSGPSAALASASAGDSEETSQTETEEKESGDKDTVKKKKAKEKKAKTEETEKDMSDSSTPEPEEDTMDPTVEASEEKDEESPAGADGPADASGDLVISTNKETTISGNVSGNIVVTSPQGADLRLKSLQAKDSALHVENGAGSVGIHLTGKNVLDSVQIDNSVGVQIYGPGILKVDSAIKGAAAVNGGNIQARFENAPQRDGKPLYAVSVNGLEKDKSYTIKDMKAGTPQAAYTYGDSILADGDGGLIMYLPAGKAQVSLEGVTYEGNVTSGNDSELKAAAPPATDTPSPKPTTPPATDTPEPSDQQAKAADNEIHGIKKGNAYRAGAELVFYAIGAGYGPKEPQEIDPVRNATRYMPVSWSIVGTSETGKWTKYTDKTDDEYRFWGSFVLNTDSVKAVPYILQVKYQKEVYDGAWKAEGKAVTKEVDFYIKNTSTSVTPTDIPDQQAKAADNGLYWINEGATYRSGANLQFYATGAGYGPDEAQELNPERNATRYVPVNWNVSTTSSNVSGTSGSWTKKNRETTVGSTSGNVYTPGEYRFKGAFVVSTNQAAAVPCTLRVDYQKEVYNGKKWKTDGTMATKSVSFYIRNVSLTATPTRYSTPYTRSGVTTTAARNSVSSNARNASTMDNTPIGTLVLLMMAAAGSGAVIFRKKRNRS